MRLIETAQSRYQRDKLTGVANLSRVLKPEYVSLTGSGEISNFLEQMEDATLRTRFRFLGFRDLTFLRDERRVLAEIGRVLSGETALPPNNAIYTIGRHGRYGYAFFFYGTENILDFVRWELNP